MNLQVGVSEERVRAYRQTCDKTMKLVNVVCYVANMSSLHSERLISGPRCRRKGSFQGFGEGSLPGISFVNVVLEVNSRSTSEVTPGPHRDARISNVDLKSTSKSGPGINMFF